MCFKVKTPGLFLYLSSNGIITNYDAAANGTMRYDIYGRISKIGEMPIHYDINSRIDSIGAISLSYDLDNRIKDVGNIQITYDLSGRISTLDHKNISFDVISGKVIKIASAEISYNVYGEIERIVDNEGIITLFSKLPKLSYAGY